MSGRRLFRLKGFVAPVVLLAATALVLGADVTTTTEVALPIRTAPGGRPSRPAGPPARTTPTTDADGAPATSTPTTAPATPGQNRPDLTDWAAAAKAGMDDTTLVDGGISLPDGANLLAARIVDGGPSPAYQFYEAGGGAFTDQFYVASSIKLLAALGALDLARSYGFSGEATVDGGYTIQDIYDAAIRWSSNDDYSWLVRIAGVEHLNDDFLPAEGYPGTKIQEAYGDESEQVAYSPPMTLAEGDRSADVPEREDYDDLGCGGSNCSDLFDLVDAIRRVVLDGEIPAGERFPLYPSDVAGLQDALLGADSWIAPGVHDVLGPDAQIWSKPGWVGGLDCVDTALVSDPTTGHRYLIGITVPDWDYAGCDSLATIAGQVLTILEGHSRDDAVRTDGSTVEVVDGRQAGVRP